MRGSMVISRTDEHRTAHPEVARGVARRADPGDSPQSPGRRRRAPAGGPARAAAGRRARAARARRASASPASATASSASSRASRRSPGPGSGGQPYLTQRLAKLLAQAEDEAATLKDEYVSVEHLLLAMLDDSGAAGRLLKEFGAHPRASSWRRCRACAATSASPRQNPEGDLPGAGEVRPRPDRSSPRRASSIRSSAATRRSAASSRCCRAAPRTTRC